MLLLRRIGRLLGDIIWEWSERWKSRIMEVKPGDTLVVYVMQHRRGKQVVPPRIAGVYEVVSSLIGMVGLCLKPYSGNRTYPYRVRLKPVKIARKIVDFRELIPRFKFIKNKVYWTGSLRQAMRRIPPEDYQTILSSIT